MLLRNEANETAPIKVVALPSPKSATQPEQPFRLAIEVKIEQEKDRAMGNQ
jgi:hypothetical protein